MLYMYNSANAGRYSLWETNNEQRQKPRRKLYGTECQGHSWCDNTENTTMIWQLRPSRETIKPIRRLYMNTVSLLFPPPFFKEGKYRWKNSDCSSHTANLGDKALTGIWGHEDVAYSKCEGRSDFVFSKLYSHCHMIPECTATYNTVVLEFMSWDKDESNFVLYYWKIADTVQQVLGVV